MRTMSDFTIISSFRLSRFSFLGGSISDRALFVSLYTGVQKNSIRIVLAIRAKMNGPRNHKRVDIYIRVSQVKGKRKETVLLQKIRDFN